jgi:hypothetical protein
VVVHVHKVSITDIEIEGREGMRDWVVKAVVAMVVLLLLPGVSHALTLSQKALVGLRGVEVIVENMQPEADRRGLNRNQIQTDVELRLRKAGVRVLTEDEMWNTPGMPTLIVNVNTVFGTGICAYSVHVELTEKVKLDRGFSVSGAIWEIGMIGAIGTGDMRKIREYVGDMVDKFINDYLAANPKK